MKKPDEVKLMVDLYRQCGGKPHEVVKRPLDINYKRFRYLISKWSDRDLMNYGCSVDCPWFESKGISIAKKYVAKYRLA